MKAATASWRVRMKSMPALRAASRKSSISPPGSPNMRATPASRRVVARTSAHVGITAGREYHAERGLYSGQRCALSFSLSIIDSNAIFQDRCAVLRDRQHELRRPRRGLLPGVRGVEHAPGAADRLVHFDGDRRRLVVAKRNLVLHFVHVRRDLLEVDLAALAGDVERVADLEVQLFVLRRVVDPIFADELHAA